MFSAEYKEHYKKTFRLAFPICLSNLGHIMVGIVDTAMVGQLGSTEIAGVALASSLFYIVLVFGIGISFGVTPLVASADSEKNISLISQLLKNSIAVNLLVGVLMFILLFVLSPILSLFNQEPQVVNIAIPFLNVLVFSMIPLSIFSAFKQFTEGLSLTRMAMIVSIAGNLINILFNYILIFGHAGFEPMGVIGSAWASFIARVIMAAWMFVYVFYGRRFISYRKELSLHKLSVALGKKILGIGIPSGLQAVFEIGAFSFAVIMIGWIGPKEQAAHQIAISLAAAAYMVASGIAAAGSVRVGNYLGRKDAEGLLRAGRAALLMTVLFMLFSALIFVLFRKQLPLLFNNEPEVIHLTSSLILIAAIFQLADGTQAVSLGLLRGIKDVKFPTFVTLVAYWIIGLPLGYWFAFSLGAGVEGIWYGLTLGLFFTAVLLTFRFHYSAKRKINNSHLQS